MKSFAFSTAVMATVASVLALPASTVTDNTVAPQLQARGALGIYLCTEANWNGACFHNTNFPSGQCFNWQIVGSFIDSVGPDPGTQCYIFDQSNCAGGREGVGFPGNDNLARVGWGNRMESFFCVAGGPAKRDVEYVNGVPAPYTNITVVGSEWPFTAVAKAE